MSTAKDVAIAPSSETDSDAAAVALVPRAAKPPAVAPRVSVIVAWPHSADALREMLMKHASRSSAQTPDMIVVTSTRLDHALIADFPDVRFVPAPADATAARMRKLGMREASGDVVMLIDADDIADENGVVVSAADAVYPGAWRRESVLSGVAAFEDANGVEVRQP